MRSPWEKFSLPARGAAYASGRSPEFVRAARQIFGPLVDRVETFPEGRHPWLMAEVPAEGSLSAFFRDLEPRLEPAGSLWVVFPKKPFMGELGFPFLWIDVQKAGLAVGAGRQQDRRVLAPADLDPVRDPGGQAEVDP